MNNTNPSSPEFSPIDHSGEDTISFIDILLILARQLKIIIITPTIICTMTIFYVQFFAKPVYTSSSKIMSSSGGSGVSQAAGLAAQFGITLDANQSQPKWVYPDVIKSRTMARLMLKRKFDTNEFGPQKSLLQILSYGNEKPKTGLDTLEINAVGTFLSMVKVSEDVMTGIYTLTLSASESQFASDLNAALIEELDSHQRKYNKAITSETRQFIEERIIETKKELVIAEEMLMDFTKSNRRIENSPLLLLEQQRLSREVSVLIGVFTTLKQQLEKTKIDEVKESDYVITLDPPEASLNRSKPNKKMMVILAGLIGVGLGIGIGLLREYVISNKQRDKFKIEQAKMLISKNLLELLPRRSKKK